MLNPRFASDCVDHARNAAPSLRGNAVQLSDALNTLSGADMHDLAIHIPFETARAAQLIRETLDAVLILQALRNDLAGASS